jgi:diguanylate cyclase (GGDEF)-like protein
MPDAWSVLSLLSAALRDEIAGADLEIRLDGFDHTLPGPPLVDAAGYVIGALSADAEPLGSDSTDVAALVAAYGYVLQAERAVRLLTARVKHLEAAAYRDPLTGLLNRRAWQEAAEREQARAARQPRPVAVVVVDLDQLKEVNDAHGHLAGDVLLRLTGSLLREVLRPADVVARIGGDEFAALLVDVTDDDAEQLADRIRADLADRGVEASVGVAIHANGDRLEEAFQEADRAMYRRKKRP